MALILLLARRQDHLSGRRAGRSQTVMNTHIGMAIMKNTGIISTGAGPSAINNIQVLTENAPRIDLNIKELTNPQSNHMYQSIIPAPLISYPHIFCSSQF